MRTRFLLLFFLVPPFSISAQNDIGGIINRYAEVVAIGSCAGQFEVDDASGFSVGQAVLIIQMKGADLRIEESPAFGDILDPGAAGRYERGRIAAINGNTVILEREPANSYDPAGDLQLVSFPEYDDATVTSTLTARSWDGSTGGVLALEVRGTLRLEADLDVSEQGFRGGLSDIIQANDCSFLNNIADYGVDRTNWKGAPKGEGIGVTVNKENARGPQGNGGGGGNDHNSGGGGGANVTAGGRGGENREPSFFGCDGLNPGLGGKPAPADPGRAYLGGGGGGGHENNEQGSDGGNGGGLIFLLAETIESNDRRLLADGGTPAITFGDGGGGGGAGGTILLNAGQINGTLTIQATGGNGGDIDNRNDDRCYGPGGGGSGGRVLANQAAALTIDLSPGEAGRSINSTACPDSPNGAQPGVEGVIDGFPGIPEGNFPAGPPAIIQQPALIQNACSGEVLTLLVEVEGSTSGFQWEVDRGSGFTDLLETSPYIGVESNRLTISPLTPDQTGFRYRLRLSSDCFDDDFSDPILVEVGALPEAAFIPDQQGPTIQFDNQSLNAQEYEWTFGDGTTSDAAAPVHTYDAGGRYTVTLKADNDCGADTVQQTVTVVLEPVVAFDAFPGDGCAPLEVQFQNSTLGATAYRWQFPGGEPATSTEAEPQVRYPAAGTYDVQLIAENEFGNDTLLLEDLIRVSPSPVAAFTPEVSALEARFLDNSTNATGYQWDFGDGNTSTEVSPSHVYTNPGTYTVLLIVENECGQDTTSRTILTGNAPVAGFQYDPATGCRPHTVQFTNTSTGMANRYEWSFPGGEPAVATDPNPEVRYDAAGTYDVQLVVENEFGRDSVLLTDVIQVNTPPSAGFMAETTGLAVIFEDNALGANQYRWDFGDGNNSNDAAPVHTYAVPGRYTVVQVVENECGRDTVSRLIEAGSAPEAEFQFDAAAGCRPHIVQFSNTTAGIAERYEWSFPGGEPAASTEPNPQVRYNTAGSYDVQLIAENQLGRDTLLLSGLIQVEGPPTAGFTTETTGLTVRFLNNSFDADRYEWDFGDGNSSRDAAPTHAYTTAGEYAVRLIVENDCGRDTSTQLILAGSPPQAAFRLDAPNGCTPHIVRFEDVSSGIYDNYQWSFPGGEPATSTDPNPQVLYRQAGTYPVTLILRGALGNDTLVQPEAVKVRTFPEPAFEYELRGAGTVAFNNLSEGAGSYLWNFGDGSVSREENPVHTYSESGVYQVTLNAQNENCASAVNQTLLIVLTGTAAAPLPPELRIFPNPARDVLWIAVDAPALLPLKGRLFTAAAQPVLEITLQSDQGLDVSRLAPGIYFLVLESEQGKWIAKVVLY